MKFLIANGLVSLLSRFGRFTKSRHRCRRPALSVAVAPAQIELLESRALLTVTFHGGALLAKVEAQAVYMGSEWNTSAYQPQTTQLDTYVSTIVNSGYMDMLTNAGYNVGRGTSSAGVVENISLTTGNKIGITDAQIQSNLQAMISANQVQAPDANRLYIVYVEPNVVVQLDSQDTSATTFLGYHGAFGGTNASGQPIDIHYAVMAYPGGPNFSAQSQGFSSNFDDLTVVSSHEIAEAVTDPNVNYKALGWYDDQLNGEIGDLAAGNNSTLPGPNGITYLVQDEVNKNDQLITPSTTTTTLTSPNLTVTAASSTSANLSWNSVTGASGFRVYLVNGSTSTLLTTLSSSATSYMANSLTAGSNVSFKVEAYNSTTTADSSVVSVQLPSGSQGLTAPTLSVQGTSPTQAQLSWGTGTGATGFRVYVVNGTTRTLLTTLGASSIGYTVNNLVPGSKDSFQVEAFNTTSIADSSVASVTLANLATPQATVQAVSSTTASVGWGSVTGAQGYRVYAVNGTTTTLLATLGASSTSYLATQLTPGSQVSFKVEAFNSTAVADSAIVSTTLPSNSSTLTAPQVSVLVLSPTSAELLWPPVSGATGYSIYWMNGNTRVLLGTVGSNSTGVMITGLAAGATTNFVVEAFNGTSVADSQVISVVTPPQTHHHHGLRG